MQRFGRTVGLCMMGIGLAGCGGDLGTDDPLQSGMPALGPGGDCEKLPTVVYESSGRRVTPVQCRAPGGEHVSTAFIDELGNFTTLAEELARNADARRRLKSNFDDDLAQELDLEASRTAPTPAVVHADVWFAFPSALRVTRAEYENANADEQRRLLLRDRTAVVEHATRVAERVRALGATVVTRSSPGLRGRGPVLTVQADRATLERIGELDEVTEIGLTELDANEKAHGEAWYHVDMFPSIVSGTPAANGSGITVADVITEGVYDSTHLAIEPGECQGPSGPSYKCFCPAGAPNAPTNSHMQVVLGVLKNRHPDLSGGAASEARIIAGNGSGSCGLFHDIVDWTIDQGARVINRSAGNSASASRYLDHLASVAPWPIIVTSAGNSASSAVSSRVYNAVSVGGAQDNDNLDRNATVLWPSTSWKNPDGLGAGGQELPHVVAPARNIATVPVHPNQGYRNSGGTSLATPQVSGLAASLKQLKPMYPDNFIPILMVSAERGVDGPPLSLSDDVDDRDGAGLMNAKLAYDLAMSPIPASGSTASRGWFTNWTTPERTPDGSVLYTAYTSVPSGKTLRVAAQELVHVACGSPATNSNCTSVAGPAISLELSVPGGGSTWTSFAQSANFATSYQYLSVPRAGTYRIQLRVVDWAGVTGTTYWGIAWTSDS
jgi:hypothetical protein